MQIKKLSLWVTMLVLLSSFSLQSCKVSWVPAFNAGIVQDVADGSKMTDQMYIRISQTENKEFSYYAEDYVGIESQINSIILKDQARPKSATIVKIATNLQQLFIKYKTAHMQRTVISEEESQIFNSYLQAQWKSLLRAEMALK